MPPEQKGAHEPNRKQRDWCHSDDPNRTLVRRGVGSRGDASLSGLFRWRENVNGLSLLLLAGSSQVYEQDTAPVTGDPTVLAGR